MTLTQKDKAFIWHPFTQMKDAEEPVVVERAHGCYLYATDGRAYIDAISSWWVNLHGHGHPYIAQSIAKQAGALEHVLFAGFTHPPAIRLAEKLLQLLPPAFSKVFYSDNGSTAVEVGLKMALQYWYNQGDQNKTRIIALEGAYHGDTFGAMAAGARSSFTAPFQSLLFQVDHLPLPHQHNWEECLTTFTRLLETGTVAAFIFEPLVQGAAGMQMYEATYLEQLLSLARQYGVLCIADEVMTGFGRTGRLFACDYLSETPDILCISKGITGGFLPLGATVCTEDVFAAFYSEEVTKAFFHGHSYTANPLACAAAVASLELLQASACQEQIRRITEQHATFIPTLQGHPLVKEVRQTGTILALELRTREDTSYFNPVRQEVYRYCMNKGVLLRPLGNVLYCMPPYCINSKELNYVHEVMSEVVSSLEKYR